ncbi:MAG: DUF1656 domain-containing protein [Betaproteobacteria bacterium]|nr:DUF1656 domain-containing protein [Betaproteobacteria bacterium]
MYEEFSLYGVFIPTLMPLMLVAFLVFLGLHLLLLRVGVYRHVWHPPLFNFALYILVLGTLFALMRAILA